MKTQKARLDSLPIETLIRLWFRRLWQRYDAGGISVGRSLRCDLLDCYLDLTRIPKLPGSLDDYSEDLNKEILSRPPFRKRRTTLKLEEITRYSKKQVALSGLGALLALEWSVDADTAWNNGYELERRDIQQILERFDYITVSPTDNIEVVSKAILSRKRDIQSRESQRTYRKLLPKVT